MLKGSPDIKGLYNMQQCVCVCMYEVPRECIPTCLYLQVIAPEQYSDWFLTSRKGNVVTGLFFTEHALKHSILNMCNLIKIQFLKNFLRPHLEIYLNYSTGRLLQPMT